VSVFAAKYESNKWVKKLERYSMISNSFPGIEAPQSSLIYLWPIDAPFLHNALSYLAQLAYTLTD
jgi:hypothetical protein